MISGVIYSALQGLVGGRCYPMLFPQPADGSPPTWPAIRYSHVGVTPDNDICGTPPMILMDTRVQIDVVAKTPGAVFVLRDQVMAALAAITSPPCHVDTVFDAPDAETRTYRVVIEATFYPSSALTGSP